jgi:hypothetical protein
MEIAVGDARNMYILQVNQMDYALKFYIEQYLVELDKVKMFFLNFLFCILKII